MALEPFDVVDLIRTKRDRGTLTTAQIDWMVDAYTRGYIADEQMSAMTMAIFLNGMEREEITALTLAMVASGTRLDFSGLEKRTTDTCSFTRNRCRRSDFNDLVMYSAHRTTPLMPSRSRPPG